MTVLGTLLVAGRAFGDAGSTGRLAPLALPSNDDCPRAIAIPSGSLPVVTAAVDVIEATP